MRTLSAALLLATSPISKIFKFGKQPVSLGVQGGYYAVSPPGGPEWRLRAIATFLFPTG